MFRFIILILSSLFPLVSLAQDSLYDRLKIALQEENDIDRLLSKFWIEFQNEKINEKCFVLNRLLLEYEKQSIEKYILLSYNQLIFCKFNNKKLYEKELENFEKKLEKMPNQCDKAVFWLELAWNILNNSEDETLANSYFLRAKKLVDDEKCKTYYIYILLYEAKFFQKKKQMSSQLAKLIKAEDFHIKNNLNFDWILFNIQNEIANIHFRAENYSSAEVYWQKVAEIIKKNKWNDRAAISSLNSLALAQKALGKYQQAENNFLKAIELAEKIKDSIWIGIPQGNIADIDIIQKEYERAEKRIMIYLEYAEKFEEHGIIVAAHIKLADLFYLKKDFKKALQYLRNGENYCFTHQEQIENINYLAFLNYQKKLFDSFVKVLEEENQIKEALKYSKKLADVTKLINEMVNKEKITELEGVYRFAEQEREKKLLQEINKKQEQNLKNQEIIILVVISFSTLLLTTLVFYLQIRRKYVKNLEYLNDFKNKMFSIISHDLRSYLSSLKGYVYLVQNQELDDNTLKTLTQELSKNTESTFSLVDNLLLWAKSQLGGRVLNFNTYNLKNILDEAVFEIGWFAQNKSINIEMEVEEEIYVNVDKNILGIALRNIINNSIKFSNTNSNIAIKARKQIKDCIISIKDNGIGISKENLEKIKKGITFTEKGTLLEKGTGMGLMLIQNSIKELGASLSIESKLNEGTVTTIIIPISKINPENENSIS